MNDYLPSLCCVHVFYSSFLICIFVCLFVLTSTMSEDCTEQSPGDRHHPGISAG